MVSSQKGETPFAYMARSTFMRHAAVMQREAAVVEVLRVAAVVHKTRVGGPAHGIAY
jgi:hypothetical protein